MSDPTSEKKLPVKTGEDQESEAALTVLRGRQELWKQAQAMSQSGLVPSHFRGKPGDCFIMADLACRLGTPLLPTLQSTYIVHGKPGFEGKFVAALLEGSGKVVGPLDYEFSGSGDDYGCCAVVHDRALNKTIRGPKVDWRMVKAERWDEKDGSKWKSLPELMFHYRAAAFLVRTRYPSVLMGMNTVDELQDAIDTEAHPVEADAQRSKTKVLAAHLNRQRGDRAGDRSEAEEKAQPADDGLPADYRGKLASAATISAVNELERAAKIDGRLSQTAANRVTTLCDQRRQAIRSNRGGRSTAEKQSDMFERKASTAQS